MNEAQIITEKTQALLAEARALIAAAVDDDPCHHDHHGYCQTHWLEKHCTMEAMRNWLDKMPNLDSRPVTIAYRVLGENPGHTIVQLFVGRNPGARGNAGSVTFRTDELAEIAAREGWDEVE